MTKQGKFKKAVKENDIETVKELLKDSEVDPNGDDNYAVKLASYKGHVEIVKLLLDDDRVNPDGDDNYAIILASLYNRDKVVNMLYYDYRICHLQLVLDIIKKIKYIEPIGLIKKLIDDTDLQIYHPENESLDKKINSLDLIKELYEADEETKQAFIKSGFNQDLFTFISLL